MSQLGLRALVPPLLALRFLSIRVGTLSPQHPRSVLTLLLDVAPAGRGHSPCPAHVPDPSPLWSYTRETPLIRSAPARRHCQTPTPGTPASTPSPSPWSRTHSALVSLDSDPSGPSCLTCFSARPDPTDNSSQLPPGGEDPRPVALQLSSQQSRSLGVEEAPSRVKVTIHLSGGGAE